MTDGRGRVGMRAARAEGLGKEPDRRDRCEFQGPAASLLVRAQSQPGNEISQERKKEKPGRIQRGRGQKEIPRSGLGAGGAEGRYMCVF